MVGQVWLMDRPLVKVAFAGLHETFAIRSIRSKELKWVSFVMCSL